MKCDRAAALRLHKAHSRYLTTFLRSGWGYVMFAGVYSHQCAPTSSKSSALAKPFRPAHGPPFKWLYSSSSTAKFQSCAISASTLECRSLSPETILGWQARRLPAASVYLSNDKEEKVRTTHNESTCKHEQKHIGAADQPYRNPDDVRQPYLAIAASAFETFGSPV